MSKIISISSSLEESIESSFIQGKLNDLSQQLKDKKVNCKKLTKLRQELTFVWELISYSLNFGVKASDRSQNKLETMKDEVSSLLLLCDEKLLDRKIELLTEKAQKISHQFSSNFDKCGKQVSKIKKQLYLISHTHALTLENKKMLHVIKNHLDNKQQASSQAAKKIKKGSIVRLEVQKALQDNHLDGESSVTLYEIAGDLYYHRLDLAKMHYLELPFSDQMHLREHLGKRGMQLDKLGVYEDIRTWGEELYPLIEGILGYVSMKTYGEDHALCKEDIDEIFLDPMVVEHYRPSVNQ